MERMRAKRAQLAPNDSQARFESLGIDVFRGEARFISPHEVAISPSSQSSQRSAESRSGREREAPGEGQALRGRNFVIATGSRAAIPKIDGLEAVSFFTNETIFDELHEKPRRMNVLGGGPVGCELTQAFGRLGVKVTIVHNRHQLLPMEDQDVAEFMQKRFAAEGIDVRLNAKTQRVRNKGGEIILETNGGEVAADALLIAAGRTANFEQLNLAAAGVKHTTHGVEVNDYMQTSQPHIYAAGDVANRLKFTHTADFTARAVVRNILMPLQLLRQKVKDAVVPWCTYTDPEVAHVGLGEGEAMKRGTPYDLFVVPLAEVDRAVVESAEAGFVKILTRQGSDRILGATIVAPHGGDLGMAYLSERAR